MKSKLATLFIVVIMGNLSSSAYANSLSFDRSTYTGQIGSQIHVTVSYDFSDEPMIFAWFDMRYNTSVLQLVSYTQAPLQNDAQSFLSPEGSLTEPGFYETMGVGSGDLFNFMNSSGEVGTFVFEVVGQIAAGLSMTPCAEVLCLTPAASAGDEYSFANFDGADVTEDFLPGGFLGAHVATVPLPGALWLFAGAIGLLLSTRQP